MDGYERQLKELHDRFEGTCKRCGACCGADDDPCVNLVRQADGTYNCAVYENRFGPQKTVSGNFFNCVTLRENIARGWHNPDCAYCKPKTCL